MTGSVRMTFPEEVSINFTSPPHPPTARRWPFGDQATEPEYDSPRGTVYRDLPVATSQTVISFDELTREPHNVASCLPSGLKATEQTVFGHLSVYRSWPVWASQSFAVSSAAPVAIQRPSELNSTSKTDSPFDGSENSNLPEVMSYTFTSDGLVASFGSPLP